MSFRSVSDVSSPAGLSPVMQIEFNVLKAKLAELESQWRQLVSNENPDQVRYSSIVRNEYESMIDQTRKLSEIRRSSILEQYEIRMNKINAEFEENKKHLFKRIIRGYYLRYQEILKHLQELLGADFDGFYQNNEIDFPQIPATSHAERNISQPDEVKLELSHNEIEKQISKLNKAIERLKIAADDETATSNKTEE